MSSTEPVRIREYQPKMEHVTGMARERGVSLLSMPPVGRTSEAIHFFHGQGFTILGHIERLIDVQGNRVRVDGEQLAGRDFRV